MQFDRLRRREFITLLGGSATWAVVARAQQSYRNVNEVRHTQRASLAADQLLMLGSSISLRLPISAAGVVDVQYALIKLRLDVRRVGIERQGNCSTERAIAALHHVPVLILVLLVPFGPFLAADATSRRRVSPASTAISVGRVLTRRSIWSRARPTIFSV